MPNLALNLAHYVFCYVHSNRIFSKRNDLKNINFPELTEVLNELIFFTTSFYLGLCDLYSFRVSITMHAAIKRFLVICNNE